MHVSDDNMVSFAIYVRCVALLLDQKSVARKAAINQHLTRARASGCTQPWHHTLFACLAKPNKQDQEDVPSRRTCSRHPKPTDGIRKLHLLCRLDLWSRSKGREISDHQHKQAASHPGIFKDCTYTYPPLPVRKQQHPLPENTASPFAEITFLAMMPPTAFPSLSNSAAKSWLGNPPYNRLNGSWKLNGYLSAPWIDWDGKRFFFSGLWSRRRRMAGLSYRPHAHNRRSGHFAYVCRRCFDLEYFRFPATRLSQPWKEGEEATEIRWLSQLPMN